MELVAASRSERAAARRHHRAGPQAARHLPLAAGEDQCHAEHAKASAWSLRAGRSRFTLSSLPAAEFPVVEEINAQQTLTVGAGGVPPADRQDAFLDGAAGCALLPQRAAARDRRQGAARGRHRWPPPGAVRDGAGRQGATSRTRSSCRARACWSCSASWVREGKIELAIGTNHVRAQIGDIRFTSKLIDGRFPEYGRVIPASPPRSREADRETLAAGAAAHGDPFEREVPGHPPDRRGRTC